MFIIKIEDNLLDISKKHGPALKSGGEVNRKMGQFVYKDIEKYVPRKTGALINSSKLVDTGKYSSINWDADYAHYAYDGKNRKRELTGKRGPRWMERYKHEREAHVRNAVQKSVQEELDKGV